MIKPRSLQNFLKMTPDIPQYSDNNQHYLISGCNPTYYLDTPGIQEEQIAPLVASNTWQQLALNAGGAITDITEDIEPTYSAFVIDTTATVYGINITGNSYTSLGSPSGSPVTSNRNKVKCFASSLYAIVTNSASTLYKRPFSTGTWTSLGLISGTGEESFAEPFLEYIMVTYQTTQIRKLDSSGVFNIGVDLGVGWNIKGMRNYNDTYLAIAGANGNFNNNYLFIWNGRDDQPNYSVKMAGRYLDMKVIDGTLYVAVWISGGGNTTGVGKAVLYYLSGTKLRKAIIPQISMINEIAGDKGCIFNFLNRVGINLDSTDLLIYAKTDVGDEEFVLSTGLNFTKFSDTYDGFIIGSVSNSLYFYNNRSTTYNPINYKSQWMPVDNLDGIDIFYDTPPQSGTDAIMVTIYGRGEDIQPGSSVTVLDPITPSTILNTSRTRLDTKGFTGDKLMIQLSTTSSSGWRPIIRAINPV